jgi:DNA-directed RNA polymerase subunit E'/Rpb7
MQEQKNKNKTKLCKLRISSEHEQWQRSISESARRLSKRQSIRVRMVHIAILNERLKELNGYDEIMWHLITLMKRKPVLLH